MKRLSILFALLQAGAAWGVNVTNYPMRTVAQPSDWFWLSSVPDKTNYNMAWPSLLSQLQSSISFPTSGIQTNYGSGTNNTLVNVTIIGGNMSQAPVNLPIVFIKPDGSYSYNGISYYTTNSPTSGIQEAITTLAGTRDGSPSRTSGGTIFMSPGTYYTTTNIFTPWGTNNLFTLNIIGSGHTSSGITYVGSSSNEVITIGTAHSNATVTAFLLKDLWICSQLNTNTRLVHLHGRADYTMNNSTVGGGWVERVWFRNGTNMDFYTHNYVNNQLNLIGLDVDCNYNNPIIVRDCIFFDLDCGISWASDWGTIQNNIFLFGGNSGGATNCWPKTSPYSMAPSVLFTESRSAVGRINGHKGWYVYGNSFVFCAPQYVSVLATNTMQYADVINRVTIWQDSRENSWSGEPLAASAGCNLSFVNGHTYDQNGVGALSFGTYLITNTVDYSTWKNVVCPTNVIKFTSFE